VVVLGCSVVDEVHLGGAKGEQEKGDGQREKQSKKGKDEKTNQYYADTKTNAERHTSMDKHAERQTLMLNA